MELSWHCHTKMKRMHIPHFARQWRRVGSSRLAAAHAGGRMCKPIESPNISIL